MKDAWDKLKELQEHPELAGTPGYEPETLREEGDPIPWFLLLMKQPQFAPPRSWWFELYNRCDLPWARLLAAQPQFEEYCRWESVSRLELVKLSFLAPEIFRRNFPQGRRYDLYAFLTPLELKGLLSDVPQAAEELDMEEVGETISPDGWLFVLSCQPQLEKYFDWATVEKRPSNYWECLLRRQPQFADHCDFSLLGRWQITRILMKQPQLADRCDLSRLTPEDRKKLEEKGIVI